MIEVNAYTAKAEPVKPVSRRQVFVVRLRPGELPAFWHSSNSFVLTGE